MTLTLTINMNTETFEEYPANQAARILSNAAEKLRSYERLEVGNELFLYDSDGSDVGSIVITGDDA